MKMSSVIAVVLLFFVPICAQSEETQESLLNFFGENMPVAVWPPQAEKDFAVFLGSEPLVDVFVHKSSFGSPDVPAALLLYRPIKESCGYLYDKLRIVEYMDEKWKDVMRGNPLDGFPPSGGATRGKNRYCVDFSMLDLPEERKLVIRNYVNGVMQYPWVYDNDGDYDALFDSVPVDKGIIYEWFGYHFPDNSRAWPEEALRTMVVPPHRAFIWKGDLLNTGNPSALILTDKDVPASSDDNTVDESRHFLHSGKNYFHEITIMEYREEWKGWRERLSVGENVRIDGVLAGYPTINPRDSCLHMTFFYDKKRKNIGVCSEIMSDCLPKKEVVRCVKYGRNDKFDVSGFVKPMRQTRVRTGY